MISIIIFPFSIDKNCETPAQIILTCAKLERYATSSEEASVEINGSLFHFVLLERSNISWTLNHATTGTSLRIPGKTDCG